MGQFLIRNAISSDIPLLLQLDHGYSTDHVWQMAVRRDREEIAVSFREVRLPRTMRVVYPRDPQRLLDEWTLRSALFVAEQDGQKIGYIALIEGPAPKSAWVTDLVVGLPDRRQGVGSKLLSAGIEWCKTRKLHFLVMEMQSKNYPAISLAKKMGLRFTGYSDAYFPNQDIALFFTLVIG
jgi:GNAT superfamily N-acetyltransferase